MKQIAQNYKTGSLELIDVPVPRCVDGGVVVKTDFSLISAGTELMKVGEARLSLIGKAKARPDQVKKVLESVSQQGLSATYRKVMNRLDSYSPLGYSLSGTVVESRVAGIPVGARVACAGNDQALHAEFNSVPKNLCVLVPDGVKSEHAAFATVGSIALHGFRQSESRLGETVAVIGLGLLGQLVTQIAVAAGARVVGIDPSEHRCKLAMDAGADFAAAPEDLSTVRQHLGRLTGGHGADAVFLAASTESNSPVLQAADLARDRARVVDLGKLPLDLPWKEYYEKELEVRFSRSYGPGRYDAAYELEGVDYPIGYVRWTERRNMEAFLTLVEGRRLNLDPLIGEIAPFESAVQTYEKLAGGGASGVATLFRYSEETPLVREISNTPTGSPTTTGGAVRVAVIGAGNYAKSMLLPFLAENPNVELVAVATSTALSGATAVKRFGFERSTTDYELAIGADDIDAVVIATRHDSHSSIATKALMAGKAVFVEKPLAINRDQFERVAEAVSGNDRLHVGFNRRFSPLLGWLRDAVGGQGLSNVHYAVNASDVQAGSWYSDAANQGSRFVGEGGHFIDTVSWWIGEDPVGVIGRSARLDPDGLEVTLIYPGGAIATISYTTDGSSTYPKESFVASGGGVTARLDNFRSASVWKGRKVLREKARRVDKGQASQLQAFIEAVRTGSPMPVAARSLLATTEATLGAAESAMASGQTISLIPR